MRSREPLAGFVISIASLLVVGVGCSRRSSPGGAQAGDGSAAIHAAETGISSLDFGPLTKTFSSTTDKFYTGQVQLEDLAWLSESLLALPRDAAYFDERKQPRIHHPLVVPTDEDGKLQGELVVLPASANGDREFQLLIQGPATCGSFLRHAESRDLTISIGYDRQGQPAYCVGIVQDNIRDSPAAFWLYQGLSAAPVGAVYKIGADESYWRPINLSANLEVRSVAEQRDGHRAPVPVWEYVLGEKGASAPGRLADVSRLAALLPMERERY